MSLSHRFFVLLQRGKVNVLCSLALLSRSDPLMGEVDLQPFSQPICQHLALWISTLWVFCCLNKKNFGKENLSWKISPAC